MPTEQKPTQDKSQRNQERRVLTDAIGKKVLLTLGQPTDLHTVQVRQLWDDHFRVNVLVGADASSVKVAHSYFLVADGEGNVVTSTPAITKHYAPVNRT